MKHYGVNVTVQYRDNFRIDLKEAGISYTELPILEPDVLSYEYHGQQMFAVIKPCEESEKIYLTGQIPLDMSWENLIKDCDAQSSGSEPMELHTKAYVLLQSAIKVARDAKNHEDSFTFTPLVEPTAREISEALISVGATAERILEMDHHDIDDSLLDELRRA